MADQPDPLFYQIFTGRSGFPVLGLIFDQAGLIVGHKLDPKSPLDEAQEIAKFIRHLGDLEIGADERGAKVVEKFRDEAQKWGFSHRTSGLGLEPGVEGARGTMELEWKRKHRLQTTRRYIRGVLSGDPKVVEDDVKRFHEELGLVRTVDDFLGGHGLQDS